MSTIDSRSVLFTNCCESFRNVLYSLKRKLREKKMADFIMQKCNGYKIIVQPSDMFRRILAEFGLGGFIPYFDASDIFFDMRVIIPKQAKNKIIEDSINYEWVLCDKRYKPIPSAKDSIFQFFNVSDKSTFNFSTAKNKLETLKSEGIMRGSIKGEIVFRKLSAIKIGFVPNSDRYNIVMRFKCSSTDITSDPKLAVVFNLFDKEKLRYAFLLSLLGIVTTAIVGLILHAYGLAG